KRSVESPHPKHLTLHGGTWGLGCNAVHILDMWTWMTGERLMDVDTERLDSKWFEATRAGNWEVLGTLRATFSGGWSAELTARQGEPFHTYVIDNGIHVFRVDEEAGTVLRSDGMSLPGRIPFQSETTGGLVDAILAERRCELPTLAQSVEVHRPLVRGL